MKKPTPQEAYQKGYDAELMDSPPRWDLNLIKEWFKGKDDKYHDLHNAISFKEQMLAYETGYIDAEAEIVDQNRYASDKAYSEGVKEFNDVTNNK